MLVENLTYSSFTLRFSGKSGGSKYCYFFDGEMIMLSLDDANNKWVWCCSLVAQEDLLVYVLTREAFDALRVSHPEIVYQLMLNLTLDLASRLRHTNKLASARSVGA